jgi:hypothetical protein
VRCVGLQVSVKGVGYQHKSYGVVVSTEDFKSFSQSSSLCRTAFFLTAFK